ncbi:MAG: glycosyltransferase family 4 protein [Thermoplasmatales archaeon]|nr:MAG: glycosyltransferase family 4 protein [Thermoplasmatales archaeon]
MAKSKDKINILFVPYSSSTFIKKDLEFLQKHFDVKPVKWRGKRDIINIAFGVLKSDVVFSWFAFDYAAVAVFFSKLFQKKSIVIVGGGDVAYVPEINYGQFTLGWHKRMLTKFALKHADRVLVVDPSLKKQIKYLLQKPCNHVKYLPTGYDSEYFKPHGKKKNIVLTVGAVKKGNIKRKDFETFVKVAKKFPDISFVLAGKHIDDSIQYLKKIAPSNVTFTGFISDEKLLDLYQKSRVYCQLSRHEGLPNALCEAMLCECIPVGSFQNGIPRAIANTGFYASWGDIEETTEALNKAIAAHIKKGKEARKRIKHKFPMEKREKTIIKLLKNIKKKNKEL